MKLYKNLPKTSPSNANTFTDSFPGFSETGMGPGLICSPAHNSMYIQDLYTGALTADNSTYSLPDMKGFHVDENTSSCEKRKASSPSTRSSKVHVRRNTDNGHSSFNTPGMSTVIWENEIAQGGEHTVFAGKYIHTDGATENLVISKAHKSTHNVPTPEIPAYQKKNHIRYFRLENRSNELISISRRGISLDRIFNKINDSTDINFPIIKDFFKLIIFSFFIEEVIKLHKGIESNEDYNQDAKSYGYVSFDLKIENCIGYKRASNSINTESFDSFLDSLTPTFKIQLIDLASAIRVERKPSDSNFSFSIPEDLSVTENLSSPEIKSHKHNSSRNPIEDPFKSDIYSMGKTIIDSVVIQNIKDKFSKYCDLNPSNRPSLIDMRTQVLVTAKEIHSRTQFKSKINTNIDNFLNFFDYTKDETQTAIVLDM